MGVGRVEGYTYIKGGKKVEGGLSSEEGGGGGSCLIALIYPATHNYV